MNVNLWGLAGTFVLIDIGKPSVKRRGKFRRTIPNILSRITIKNKSNGKKNNVDFSLTGRKITRLYFFLLLGNVDEISAFNLTLTLF